MGSSVSLGAEGGLAGKVVVPPSKSYTHRAVIAAGLSSGKSRVYNHLVSRDTVATIRACRAMGAEVEEEGSHLIVTGAEPRAPDDVVNVENSGTTLRFMTSVFALPSRGYTVLTGDASIRRRPMQGLLDALARLGAKARSANGNGCAPIIVGEGGMGGGDTEVVGDVSSQFISSILIASPLARGDTSLQVTSMVSRPYVEATLRISGLHGVEIQREGESRFEIHGGQEYRPADFAVPGDFGSAAFVMAAVAFVGGDVELSSLNTSLPQGDLAALDLFRRLGARLDVRQDSVRVRADSGRLKGGEFDLTDSPDLLPVLSVLSLKCDTPVEIRGVTHARFKESDRIRVAVDGLRQLGAEVEEMEDGLRAVGPRKVERAVLDAHDDHRMFMAFSLASLLAPGSVWVAGVESLDVSYPAFIEDLEELGARVARK
ncbi:MAG: 3-phosphoshikimate 1-carboxyvinyltransferase [Nitrososphaerota archaeon]|nr:3-phosphoshikimate 1-carboxyvinyltransferase [Nitrososphaerota archaeon]